MLSREAVAAALALAGVRTGAVVLDLAPGAGLGAAARAAAGLDGGVDDSGLTASGIELESGPHARYGHALAVWPDASAETVVDTVEKARSRLAPQARVTFGSRGPLDVLTRRLSDLGWTVLHGASVAQPERASRNGEELALAVARPPR